MSKQKRQPQVKVQRNVLEQINPNAAGIDTSTSSVQALGQKKCG